MRTLLSRVPTIPKRDVRQSVWKSFNVIVAVVTLLNVSAAGLFLAPKMASAAAGHIWTNVGPCGSPVDANHYAIGDHIYIHGADFAEGDYDWNIGKPGNSGADVASDNFHVNSTGEFCFDAYTVQPTDSGEYQVKFGNAKGDNYGVNGTVSSITVNKWFWNREGWTMDNAGANSLGYKWGYNSDLPSATWQNMGTTVDNVPFGSHVIAENSVLGYHNVGYFIGDGSCNDISEETAWDHLTLDVQSTDGYTVNFCNAINLQPTKLTVHKMIDSGDGYQAADTQANDLGFVWGLSHFDGLQGHFGTVTNLGTHAVSDGVQEANHNGYTFVGWFYGNDGSCTQREDFHQPGSSVNIGAGQSQTITLCNHKDNGLITGTKYHDPNRNNQHDVGEEALAGWTIKLYDEDWNQLATPVVTDANGHYTFDNLPGGDYVICEVLKAGWEHSWNPAGSWHNGEYCIYRELKTGDQIEGADFHNYRLPSVTISKTDNHVTAQPGETLTYQVTVTNSGDLGAESVQVNDTLPNFLSTPTNISNSGLFSAGHIVWNNLSVPGHGLITLTYDATINAVMPVGTTILHNVASLGCSPFVQIDSVSASSVFVCPYSGTATDDTSVTVVAPTLSITKTNNSGSFVNPGATVTYTIVVTNAAGATQSATNVVLNDTLPAGFTYTIGGGSTKSFNLGNIVPGASVTTTYTVLVSASQVAGTYANTATADGDNTDPVSATSNVVVHVPQVLGISSPTLSLAKTVDHQNSNPGKTVKYTLTVTNSGDGNATNTDISDTLPAGFTFADDGTSTRIWHLGTLLAGGHQTITYAVKIGSNVKAGTYVNHALATADGIDPVTAIANVKVVVPEVLGLATTGVSAKDYAIFALGSLLLALGFISLKGSRREELGEAKA